MLTDVLFKESEICYDVYGRKRQIYALNMVSEGVIGCIQVRRQADVHRRF